MSYNVLIQGLGLCTSLGNNARQTTNLYAINKRRYRKDTKLIGHDGFPILHANIIPFHDERNYVLRIIKLIELALDDLSASAPHLEQQPTALWMQLPAMLREIGGYDILQTQLPQRSNITLNSVMVFWSDQQDFGTILEMAQNKLESRELRELVLMSADSMLNVDILDALAVERRLFNRQQPHGIVPSEAAVAIYLSGLTRENALGHVKLIKNANEPQDPNKPQGLFGKTLAELWRMADSIGPVDRLMIDLNGERWRSEEIAHALSQAPNLPDHLTADPETPAFLCGHAGAANLALMFALALSTPFQAERDRPITQISHSQLNGPRTVLRIEHLQPFARPIQEKTPND